MVTPVLDTRALVELCLHNDVAKLSVFGSFARGEATERSDVDLLVEFRRRNSLLALVALERMPAVVGRRVDHLTREAISPYLRDSSERDLRVVYKAR